MTLKIRPATRADAPLLARLVNAAGEGLPMVLWRAMTEPGQDPWEVGAARMARDGADLAWSNAMVAEFDGYPAGGTISYLTAPVPSAIDAGTPAMFVPLVELENLAPGTRYINAVAVVDEARRRGIARALINEVAGRAGPNGLSLIVADGNTAARGLYASLGFAERARRPIVPGEWQTANREWVLMARA